MMDKIKQAMRELRLRDRLTPEHISDVAYKYKTFIADPVLNGWNIYTGYGIQCLRIRAVTKGFYPLYLLKINHQYKTTIARYAVLDSNNLPLTTEQIMRYSDKLMACLNDMYQYTFFQEMPTWVVAQLKPVLVKMDTHQYFLKRPRLQMNPIGLAEFYSVVAPAEYITVEGPINAIHERYTYSFNPQSEPEWLSRNCWVDRWAEKQRKDKVSAELLFFSDIIRYEQSFMKSFKMQHKYVQKAKQLELDKMIVQAGGNHPAKPPTPEQLARFVPQHVAELLGVEQPFIDFVETILAPNEEPQDDVTPKST